MNENVFLDEMNSKTMKVNTNVIEFQRNVALDYGSYRPIADGINRLKSITSDIPWNDLYDALEEGNIRDAMCKYWAKRTLMNWENIDVRNELRERFSFLPGSTRFSQRLVTRQESGEFDVSMEAIRAENLKVYERTIETDQVEAVNQLIALINELKLNPYNFKAYLNIDNEGKVIPNWNALAEVIGHR